MPPKTGPKKAQEEWARVGATLREFRQMRGLGVNDAANLIPISRGHLANIELGRRPLTPVLLARFAAVYNVPQYSILPVGFFTEESVTA